MNRGLRWTVCALVGMAGCGVPVTPAPSGQGPFSRLIVFGDSLSDTGNIHAETVIVPLAPYAGGRFSDGPVWVEVLAGYLGLQALPSYYGGTNYAQGGSGTSLGLAPLGPIALGPNVREQVDFYTDQPAGDELFVVWGGPNDVFSVLSGSCAITPATIAENIELAIRALYDRGGRFFLVPNTVDLGLTPRYNDSPLRTQAEAMSQEVNAALASRLDGLENLPGITLYRLDAAAQLANAVQHPPAGITNVTDQAWSGGYTGYLGGGTLADDPDAFIFWDHIHPTRVAHRLLADSALALIAAQSPGMSVDTAGEAVPPFPNLAPLSFWLGYFPLALQPSRDSAECEY